MTGVYLPEVQHSPVVGMWGFKTEYEPVLGEPDLESGVDTFLHFLSYLEAVLVSGSDLDREYWFPNLERARYYADPSNSENPHQTRAAEAAVDYYSNGD